MINFHPARLKKLRAPLRLAPAMLDGERSFLIRVLESSKKQVLLHGLTRTNDLGDGCISESLKSSCTNDTASNP